MKDRNKAVTLVGAAVLLIALAVFFTFGQFYGQAARTENQVPVHTAQ